MKVLIPFLFVIASWSGSALADTCGDHSQLWNCSYDFGKNCAGSLGAVQTVTTYTRAEGVKYVIDLARSWASGGGAYAVYNTCLQQILAHPETVSCEQIL
jgi:hypothetical protein